MLENDKYYNLTKDGAHELLKTQSQITPFFELIITIISGFMFEIFGRKYPLYYSILLGALSLILFPMMAPIQSLYLFSSVLWTSSI